MPRSLRRPLPSSVLVTPGTSLMASSSVLRLNVQTSSMRDRVVRQVGVGGLADDRDDVFELAEPEYVVLGLDVADERVHRRRRAELGRSE